MAREVGYWLAGGVWLCALAGGFWAWERYDATPGSARALALAPEDGSPGRWRLTVFAHPRCPCSRATLVEAAALAGEVPELSVRVLFVRPPDAEPGWARGEAWELAARVPGAEVAVDADGAAAGRFGAETSGHAVLTDPGGAVVFRGGLTQGRGRTGTSAGRRAVRDWVRGRTGAPTAPVFGCELFTPRHLSWAERERRGGSP